MAFRTDGLAKAYAAAQQQAIVVKRYSTTTRNALIAGNVSANAVLQIMDTMKTSIELWDATSALPGMAQFARDQENDQTYDVVVQFTAMRANAVAVRDWIITNFPKSAGGFIEKDTLEVNGAITVAVFTPAQTAGLQTSLATLAASIV